MTFGERLRVAVKAAVGVFSDEAQKEALGMLTGIMPGGLGAPPARGTQQFLQAYSQMPWLRAVSSRVATSVASTEWQLFVGKKKDAPRAHRDQRLQRAVGPNRQKLMSSAMESGELTQITDHVLLDTLHDANSFQTGGQMWKVTQLHLDLVGEAFWIKERDGMGVTVGLWPVPPHWVINTPTPTNRFFRVGFRAWRGMIPDTEILWFSDPDPSNPYGRGSGTAQALADELETDEYAAKHTKAFFYNRGRPDLLVYPKAPERMREQDVQRLEEDWMSRNQGFWRAFKPYFLTREVGVEQFEQNFRSQQIVQLREYERNVIIQVFGMPPELLGVLENSNRATIDAADYLMSKYVVKPRLDFLRAVIQERLIPEYDERLIVDYVSPIQEDKEMELQAATVAPWAHTLDEWRHRQGLPPLKGGKGDVHVFGAKPMSLDAAVDQAENPPEPPAAFGAGGPPKPGQPKPGSPAAPKPKPKPGEKPKPGDKPKPKKGDAWDGYYH